jgi:hypothetical protein
VAKIRPSGLTTLAERTDAAGTGREDSHDPRPDASQKVPTVRVAPSTEVTAHRTVPAQVDVPTVIESQAGEPV